MCAIRALACMHSPAAPLHLCAVRQPLGFHKEVYEKVILDNYREQVVLRT